MADVTPDPILQVASGFRAAKYLFVANEVGLFEQLAAGPATLDALAQRTGIPSRTLRILADAMVALGFVEQQHDQYHNSPVAATFLGGRGPADLRPFLRYLNQQSYPMWMELEAVVRTGRASSGHVRERRTEAQQWIASEGHAAASAATAHALATTYDFRRHRRVLDLGGGTGSYVMAVCTQYRVHAVQGVGGHPVRLTSRGCPRTSTSRCQPLCGAHSDCRRELLPGSDSRWLRCGYHC
jgi:Dimerisation domain